MLIQFSIKNYRTLKEKATLSLVASNYDKNTREQDNIHHDDKFNLRLLKSAAIYGANASGKSKFIEALMFMRHFVINSSKASQKGDEIQVEPFRLSSETESLPSEFEVVFTFNDVMYRYGFEVDKKRVVSEWLFYRPKTKEVELFYRDDDRFDTHPRSFSKGNTVIKQGLIRDNALLISVAAQFNDSISIAVIDWFKNLKTIPGLYEAGYQGFTMSQTEDAIYKAKILELLKAADLGIQDIQLQVLDLDKLPRDIPNELRQRIIEEVNEEKTEIFSDVLTSHRKYDSSKKPIGQVSFSLDDDESSGTRKFFALTGPILDVIENGHTLVVDELDSKLHPNLVCKIISLFNSQDLNKRNAQLIFNTHDTNLLSSGLFRRDQVWFTDKNKLGEASLYSLADFKSPKVRKTEAFEENYIRGKYGAVPFLGFFDHLIKALPQYENEKQES